MAKPVCVQCNKSDDKLSIAVSEDLNGKTVYVHANCKVAYEEAKKRQVHDARRERPSEHFEESAPSIKPPPTTREMYDAIMGLCDKSDKILKLLKPKKKVAKKP